MLTNDLAQQWSSSSGAARCKLLLLPLMLLLPLLLCSCWSCWLAVAGVIGGGLPLCGTALALYSHFLTSACMLVIYDILFRRVMQFQPSLLELMQSVDIPTTNNNIISAAATSPTKKCSMRWSCSCTVAVRCVRIARARASIPSRRSCTFVVEWHIRCSPNSFCEFHTLSFRYFANLLLSVGTFELREMDWRSHVGGQPKRSALVVVS